METLRVWGVSIAELERALREVEPAAVLISGRILRRVIKQDRRIPGAGLRVPHRKTYVIQRDRLLALAERDELNLDPYRQLPDEVLLIVKPEAEKLASVTRSRALVKYWRLLFHARIDAELRHAAAESRLSAADVRQRIAALGQSHFAEIASVLHSDEWLLPPADDREAYMEFVAIFFELKFFAPRLLADYFPSLRHLDAVEELLSTDVDAQAIYHATRLDGAPDPSESSVVEDDESLSQRKFDLQAIHPRKQSERLYCKLMDRADRARTRGNDVRSAMLRTRAALTIGPKLSVATRNEGRADLERLAQRLQAALGLDDTETTRWMQALAELLPNSIRALWTAEARLLYDVQKVCIDHERGVYTLDLVSWALSRGRRPIRRPLPSQREVLMSKHLHAAADRLRAARLPPDRRRRLSLLLASAVDRSEARLRSTLGPRIAQALDDVQMRPTNVPETVARDKLIEELLDTIVDRGFITIGDLRDAVARNNLKIRDVAVGRNLLRGDQLLQADERLAEVLDGVYRRAAEVYLRLPQLLSSLAFGTSQGRFLTQYVAVPFGGAFLAIEFFGHIRHSLEHWFGPGTASASPAPGAPFWMFLKVLLLGMFILGLLHRPQFRGMVLAWLRTAWQAMRFVVVELPAKALQWPPIKAMIDSPLFRKFQRYVFKPLIFSALLLAAIALLTRRSGTWTSRIAVFVAMNLLLNSRLGRNVDELVTDWVVRGWHQLRIRVFAAFFRLIMDTFSQLLEGLERLLYQVDEWLRFRRGDMRLAAVMKAVLGVAWFFVTYVVRFCVTLLIEPQVNPIKHFPVVTVSHKIILPFQPWLAGLLESQVGFGAVKANTIAGAIIVCIPGIFGFLVWELKENWRIFAANRRSTLHPVVVGRRGEPMVRLLRPGFHSGTIPKLFARLRRSDRKAYATGRWTSARKYREKLNQVRETIRHFVERELLRLLDLSGHWPAGQLQIRELHLGISSVSIEIANDVDGIHHTALVTDDVLRLTLEERAGWLVARTTRPDWMAQLSPQQVQSLAAAVTGLLKLSGVDMVLEQVEATLAPIDGGFLVVDRGVRVWPDADYDREALYDLRSEAPIVIPIGDPETLRHLPRVPRMQLLFSARDITWDEWVALWTRGPSRFVAPAAFDVSGIARDVALADR